jgi:hypothetical protein
MEGRGLHSKGLTEDTLSVLRDGGNNGNEISKNCEACNTENGVKFFFTI